MLIVSGQYTVQQVVSCSEWTFEVFKGNYLPCDHDRNNFLKFIIYEYLYQWVSGWYVCLKLLSENLCTH